MWRRALTQLAQFRRRKDDDRARALGAAPIGIVVIVAIVCVVVAVLTAAERADDVAAAAGTQASDPGDRRPRPPRAARARERRRLERYRAPAALQFRPRLGASPGRTAAATRSSITSTSSSSTAPTASPTRCSGNASVDPKRFDRTRADLDRIIDLLRGRAQPHDDEVVLESSLDATTNLNRPRRAQRLQTFMNRPAIVAGVAANMPNSTGFTQSGASTLVLAVKFVDGQLLSDISARFDLPNLRTVGDRSDPARARTSRSSPTAPAHADRALRLAAEPPGRQDRQHGAAVHDHRVRRLRAADRPGAALHPPHRHEARRGRGPPAPPRLARPPVGPAEPHLVRRAPRRRDRKHQPRRQRRGGAGDRPRSLQGHQRHARPSHRRRADQRRGAAARARGAARGSGRPARRRRVRRDHHRSAGPSRRSSASPSG